LFLCVLLCDIATHRFFVDLMLRHRLAVHPVVIDLSLCRVLLVYSR
jgi:hypothetical protein